MEFSQYHGVLCDMKNHELKSSYFKSIDSVQRRSMPREMMAHPYLSRSLSSNRVPGTELGRLCKSVFYHTRTIDSLISHFNFLFC